MDHLPSDNEGHLCTCVGHRQHDFVGLAEIEVVLWLIIIERAEKCFTEEFVFSGQEKQTTCWYIFVQWVGIWILAQKKEWGYFQRHPKDLFLSRLFFVTSLPTRISNVYSYTFLLVRVYNIRDKLQNIIFQEGLELCCVIFSCYLLFLLAPHGPLQPC